MDKQSHKVIQPNKAAESLICSYAYLSVLTRTKRPEVKPQYSGFKNCPGRRQLSHSMLYPASIRVFPKINIQT